MNYRDYSENALMFSNLRDKWDENQTETNGIGKNLHIYPFSWVVT
jgi:hypothetical protein